MVSIAGFSFGSLLALSLAALIWKLHYLSADLLKENFVRITFGQPTNNLPTVQEITEECPEFESVVHSIFTNSMSASMFGHHTNIRAKVFMRETPG